jgi:hypothetical protein
MWYTYLSAYRRVKPVRYFSPAKSCMAVARFRVVRFRILPRTLRSTQLWRVNVVIHWSGNLFIRASRSSNCDEEIDKLFSLCVRCMRCKKLSMSWRSLMSRYRISVCIKQQSRVCWKHLQHREHRCTSMILTQDVYLLELKFKVLQSSNSLAGKPQCFLVLGAGA